MTRDGPSSEGAADGDAAALVDAVAERDRVADELRVADTDGDGDVDGDGIGDWLAVRITEAETEAVSDGIGHVEDTYCDKEREREAGEVED